MVLPRKSLFETYFRTGALPFFGPLTLDIASRTDRGVHALDQKIFLKNSQPVNLTNELVVQINQHLPGDLTILNIENCSNDFHPSLMAKSKEYRYYFHTIDLPPIFFPYSLKILPFDINIVQKGASCFVGTHDFKFFEDRSSKERVDKTCTIYSLDCICFSSGVYYLKIVGNRFLYHMCRKIAGTLLYLGYGKISINQLEKGIGSMSSKDTGPTLPLLDLFYKKLPMIESIHSLYKKKHNILLKNTQQIEKIRQASQVAAKFSICFARRLKLV